jgi:hypothetical protein
MHIPVTATSTIGQFVALIGEDAERITSDC